MFEVSPPSILVHVFSNGESASKCPKLLQVTVLGGAFQLVELSRMLQATGQNFDTSLANGIIYDSAPGTGTLVVLLQAFYAPFRSLVAKILITIPLTFIFYLFAAIEFVTGQRPAFDTMREGLNKAKVLPWTDASTPRLYIYSDTDKIVQQKAVVEHFAEAKKLGLNVTEERFKESAHVSHSKADPGRYWGAVKSLWTEASKQPLFASLC
jgi:hypothetical protein